MASPKIEDPAEAREAIERVNQRFYDAFERLDLTAMDSVWAERSDVTCIHPGWAPIVGRERVIAAWVGIFRGTERIRFRLRDPRIFVAGDTAWVIVVEEIEAAQADGLVHAFAQTTNLFRREDGAWRMVHHHASPMAAPEEQVPHKRAGSRVLH